MTGNLHRRMQAIEAAERARRAGTPELLDLTHLTDDELIILRDYAQGLVDDPACDRDKLLAEAIEKLARLQDGPNAVSAGECSAFDPLSPCNLEQVGPSACAREAADTNQTTTNER